MRDLRRTIADIVSRKENKRSTLQQYWIVDTQVENALGIMIPAKAPVKINWLIRKLEQRGWYTVSQHIVKSSGRDRSISFTNLVLRKEE